MGHGLPRRDVGIIIAVASLIAGGVVTSAMLLPAPAQADGATRWLERTDPPPAPPAAIDPIDDPRGSVTVPHLFPLPDARLARQP